MTNISDINYAEAGVSIAAQNEVNAAIKKKLKDLGLDAEGLFGGAISVSHLKEQGPVHIGVVSSSIVEAEDAVEAGRRTLESAFRKLEPGTTAIAALDYFASPEMGSEVIDFVEGVARAGLDRQIPTIGGESAQMPGTYNDGKRDAYVHLITHGERGATVNIGKLINSMRRPLLCASTDGTGTKTRIVKDPRDIIYHSSNDLGAIGVQPVAFALYVAGNAPQQELEEVVERSQRICDELGLAELDVTCEFKPEEYVEGQVDIAGTVLGVVDKRNMITGDEVREGDVIVGFAADGLMTNGYSLARGYVTELGVDVHSKSIPGLEGTSIHAELSRPHVPYTDILFGNREAEGILSGFGRHIKAASHITGGGQKDNIGRMVPDGLFAAVHKEVLPLPRIVQYFRDERASMDNIYEAFNMGVGFTVTVGREVADELIQYVNTHFRSAIPEVDRRAARIGVIERGETRFEYV